MSCLAAEPPGIRACVGYDSFEMPKRVAAEPVGIRAPVGHERYEAGRLCG